MQADQSTYYGSNALFEVECNKSAALGGSLLLISGLCFPSFATTAVYILSQRPTTPKHPCLLTESSKSCVGNSPDKLSACRQVQVPLVLAFLIVACLGRGGQPCHQGAALGVVVTTQGGRTAQYGAGKTGGFKAGKVIAGKRRERAGV